MAADLKRVTDAEWYSSLGAAWLKLLGTLPQTFGPGYPPYTVSYTHLTLPTNREV